MGSTGGAVGAAPSWHVQDWLVCIEALVTVTEPAATTPRERRAWRIIETIGTACGIEPTAYPFETDDNWGPETAVEGSADIPQPAGVFEAADWQLLVEALQSFADAQRHTKRGQRARQLAAAIDTTAKPTADH